MVSRKKRAGKTEQKLKNWCHSVFPTRAAIVLPFCLCAAYAVTAVTVSPDLLTAASASADRTVKVWSIAGLPGQKGQRMVIYLLSGSRDQTLQARAVKVYPKVDAQKK
jgi:WD40 repeat protein